MCEISIVIPVFNAQKYLKECLDSVLKQTLSNIEVICVNDFSTDSSMEILKKYAFEDERVIILENEKNMGTSESRNKGISVARGEYCYFLDSDDYLICDNALEIMLQTARKDNLEMLCFGGLVKDELDDNESANRICLEKKHQYAQMVSGRKLFCDLIDNHEYRTLIGTYLYKTSYLRDNSIIFMAKSFSEDLPFIFEGHYKANRARAINDNLYCYRLRYDSKVHSDSDYLRVVSAQINFEHLLGFINEEDVSSKDTGVALNKEYWIETDFWRNRFKQCSYEQKKKYIESIDAGLVRYFFVKEVLGGFEYCLPPETIIALKESKVYLYGAGIFGKRYYQLLDSYGIDIDGYLVTENKNETIFGYIPQRFSDVQLDGNTIIIPAVSEKYKEEILKIISEKSNVKVIDLETYKV